MRRRTTPDAAFSLFSFQDIITSVMGIIVLILLVVALELATRQFVSPAFHQSLVRQDTAEALALARARLQDVQLALQRGDWSELAALNKNAIAEEANQLSHLLPALSEDVAAARHKLDLLSQKRSEAELASNARRTEEATLRRLRELRDALRSEMDQLKTSRIFFYRHRVLPGSTPWVVQLSATQILAAQLGPEQRPLTFEGLFPAIRRQRFLAWAARRDPSREYFILVIRPSGASDGSIIETELRRRFNVALDLIAEDQLAIDPERGAPTIDPIEDGA